MGALSSIIIDEDSKISIGDSMWGSSMGIGFVKTLCQLGTVACSSNIFSFIEYLLCTEDDQAM